MKRADRIDRWVKALESGEYKQTVDTLWNMDEEKPKYCCLGVACVLEGINIEEETNTKSLPDKMEKRLGIDRTGSFVEEVRYRGRNFYSLAQLNDAKVSFKVIARIIREQMAKGNFEKP